MGSEELLLYKQAPPRFHSERIRMDSASFDDPSDLFHIYSRYCAIMEIHLNDWVTHGHTYEGQQQESRFSKEALFQLLRFVESNRSRRGSVFNELVRLMSKFNAVGEFSEFSRFYDFVFFIFRENEQKSMSIARAVKAWRLILRGRFRLLNQWCDFVERNHRYNISEDTWRQVLSFTRCVHEDLKGYDPEGAWPVLIDDFVEHMYRSTKSGGVENDRFCICRELGRAEDIFTGLKVQAGLKRKVENEGLLCACPSVKYVKTSEGLESVEGSPSPRGGGSLCAVEGSLAKGFGRLLSYPAIVNPQRRVSFTF